MANKKVIRGAGGGGKGGGSARAAVEAKNTLRSRQFARIVDVICEGEIDGLVGSNISAEYAERSIYFDGVPLRNEFGQPNFDVDAFSWAFVPGTQNQPVIPTGGAVSSEVQVSQEVKAGNTGGGSVVRSIPETYIDACRVTITVPRLTEQNTENGDINGSRVTFAIDVQANGGGFVEVMAPTIKGKTNSEYQRSYEFALPGEGPWDIRVRRLTPDAEKSNIQNQIYWATYTKIVKQPLNYPNTALMGLKVDSALFSRVPSRAYKMRLLKVRVPSNYEPTTRTYTGLWNGTFKIAWTDNPAWCWYDLATNERYGLGEYLDTSSIDKWTLYAIAQYCDELVPDGYGGTEPRFTCNLLLNTREEALKVLMNFASIFRGIVYWHTNSIFCSQDRPASPVKLFTPANVIDGVFNYSGSARQARHTVALVSWNDPENLYKQTVEYVEDRESILRLGVREIEVTAMGCTSRGQANRLGKWILLTEREETDTVTFRTGLEGCGVMPGEIVQTTDPARAGERMGGRVLSATSNQLTLDGPVTLEAGKSYTVAVVLPSGAIEEKSVAWSGVANTETTTLTLGSNLAQVPQQHAVWILQTETLVPELWRVISTVEVEPNIVEITAVEHVPGKYAAVEQNLKLEARQTSAINVRPGAVTNLSATTDVKKLNALEYTTRIFVSWTPPKEGAARYVVTWRRGSENEKTEISNDPAFDIDDVPAGTFEISVIAENAIGLRGPATTLAHTVDESSVEPDVQNLRLDPDFLSQDCPIAWDRLDWAIKYTVQVLDGTTVLREVPVETNKYVYTYAQNLADGGPRRALTFKVKAHSWRGESANWVALDADNPAPAAPQGVSLEAGPGQISVFAERPADPDLEGMIVWMHTDSAVPTTDGYIVYKGKDNAFMKLGLQPGVPMYFKVAFYDTFGTTGLNVSSSVSATPTATGGILRVTQLPASPSEVSGETAVFLDVSDQNTRGLYGWDGTAWSFTRDGGYLVASSITADRMNVSQLSSISANLGTMTAGNFTLAADGFIKGGATNYSSGTGFWMGNDGGTYKLRAGSPQSSGFEWDGSAFNVRGPDGSVTISSGVVDWAKISGTGKPADGATRNVFRGDWAASTPYAVGDIVLKDGNGWSCILAHASTSSNQPPATGNGNTWWTIYAVKGSDGAQGLHALTLLVPNNAHTLPAASDGVVASYVGSGTTIQVFEGTTALSAVASITANGQFTIGTPTQLPASTITVGARSYSGATATVAQHSAMLAGTDAVVVTYPITVRRSDGTTVTLSATQTLTKSKAGVKGDAGVSAKAAFLTATSQVFQVAKNGTITPSSITLTATGQNVTGSPAFTVTSGTAALTGTGNVRALASNGLTTDAATIKIAWDGQEDFVTIVKVREGADGSIGANAIVAVLSNESHTIPTDSAGNNGVFTGANTTMTIYSGTSDDSANWTVTASASSVAGTLSGKTYTVTGLSADAGYVDLTASRSGYASIVKRFVLTKSKAGPAGSPGAQGPAGPAVVVTANRALSFTATDGALDGSQDNIVLTAAVSGIVSPTYAWTFSGLQTNPTASTTNTQTITAAQFGISKSAVVTCTVNGSFVDQVTIVRLEKSTAAPWATAGSTLGTDLSRWEIGSQTLVTVTDGKVGNTVLRLGTAVSYPTQTSFVPIDPTKKYRVRFWARPSADCNGLLYFSLRQAINETGSWGPVNGGRAPYKPSAQTRAAHNATYGTDAWGEYSYIWSAADWQTGVKFFRPEFLDNYGGTAGYWEVQGLVIEEATDVEAAKDAASAAQIAANTANNTLADIASDNKLTPVEKQSAANEWGIINRERASIQAQASALGISSELNDYNYTYAVLNDYITPLLADLQNPSAIDGPTFRDKWSYFYEYRQRLMNKMSAVAATKADWANVQSRPSDADILNAGSNLILNPDLRNSPAGDGTAANGWVFNANSGSFYYRGVLQDSANGPPFDTSQPMFYANSAGADGQVSWFTSDYIPVGLDRNYTVSAWLRRYSGNPSAYLGVVAYDGAYASLDYVYPAGLSSLNSTTLSASWEHRHGVYGPGHTAFPAGTKYVRVVWWGTYLSIGATLATRFCFNEGVVPSRSVVPLDSSLINKINPITPSNVTTYIDNAALGNAQIGGNLWSTNWSGWGGSGWLLDRSGNFYGNNIYARGDIEASSLKANTAMVQTLNIAGNAVIVPVFVEYPSAYMSNVYQSGTEREVTLLSDTVTVNVACTALVQIGCNDLLNYNTHALSAGAGGRGHYNWPNGTEWASIRLYRNGSLVTRLAQWNVNSTTKGAGLHTGGYQATDKSCVFVDNIVLQISLVAGVNTIDIRGWVRMADGDSTIRRSSNTYMHITGTQR